ncbi:hypothetical protein CLV84_0653 [Neolewinella xylanilytica]|uniref:Uncharacterized protein n=1 Tax=Neolewinella xylanilytica TaxID=1514080 RepID=A0A2S6I884_9BACT|nr:hypothetical protein [Neolewinella xylanilytica]PPK87703.1 hypothetical protein CLV84_0653 [Neolewinella xylanilytica]
MNNFLALRDEDIASFTGERQAVVRRKVERELRTAEFIASVVELFGPVMADTLNVMGGGEPMVDLDDDDPFNDEPLGPGTNRDIIR